MRAYPWWHRIHFHLFLFCIITGFGRRLSVGWAWILRSDHFSAVFLPFFHWGMVLGILIPLWQKQLLMSIFAFVLDVYWVPDFNYFWHHQDGKIILRDFLSTIRPHEFGISHWIVLILCGDWIFFFVILLLTVNFCMYLKFVDLHTFAKWPRLAHFVKTLSFAGHDCRWLGPICLPHF